MRRVKDWHGLFGLCCLLWGCSHDVNPAPGDGGGKTSSQLADASSPTLSRQQLLDPEACQACHAQQYEEWAGSMHAYASQDPVFLAMNARGQQETKGALGDFCVQCHAPLAVSDGLTTDGLNLPDLPKSYQGVTCYFCHNVEAVEGVHNNPLRLANDGLMRGPFSDPMANSAHLSAYSPHLDKSASESSQMCGACHDVALEAHFAPSDTALERTFVEWQDTLFNAPEATGGLTCNGCHMPISSRRDQSVVGQDAPKRRSRRHDFEGIDVALDDFAGKTRQRLLVQQFLDSSLLAEICVSRDNVVSVTLENAGAGHNWPSGATHDRIAWLDVAAYDGQGLVYQTAQPEEPLALSERADSGTLTTDGTVDAGPVVLGPELSLTDRVVTAEGEEAHFFWEVARVESSTTLPGVVTRDPLATEFHRERRIWELDTQQGGFDSLQTVELTVKILPIKTAVLEDLVSSGHLDLKAALAMPTFSVLPERCHPVAEVEQYPDILLGVQTDCEADSAAHSTTLTWDRSRATAENRNFRQTVIRGTAALCLAHPTYIPPP